MDIVVMTEEHEPAWERFVQGHPAGLIYYSLRFRDLLLELTGGRPEYVVALEAEEVVGGLPLISLDGVRGEVINSLPYFGSPGGPLSCAPEVTARLLAWYAERAVAPGTAAATLIENPLAPPPVPAHDLTDTRIAHITPLGGDGDIRERLFGRIEPSARRNIAKAERNGTTVAAEPDAFDLLQGLHEESMRAIGAAVKTPGFFAGVRRHLRPEEDFDLYVGRIDGRAVAALLILYAGRTVEYYVPAVSPDNRPLQPMAAVLIHAMVRSAERGYTAWNWGGSWPAHTSLQRFKAKWGGQPVQYRYWTKLNDETLLQLDAGEIQADYAGFFVVPFAALTGRR